MAINDSTVNSDTSSACFLIIKEDVNNDLSVVGLLQGSGTYRSAIAWYDAYTAVDYLLLNITHSVFMTIGEFFYD
jgi:hypothetical protein